MFYVMLAIEILLVLCVVYLWWQWRTMRNRAGFWKEKWKNEVQAHLNTALWMQEKQAEWLASEQGLYEIQENYEMDLLQAEERRDNLNAYYHRVQPDLKRYVRLSEFHEETCVPLLVQVKKGAR